MGSGRFYRHRLLQAYFRGYGALGFVIFLLIAAAKIPSALRVALVVLAFIWLYLTWVRLGRLGVEARFDGISVRRLWRTRFIPWAEIASFGIARPGMSPPVSVELVTGHTEQLPLTQGRRTSWQGGTSRDVVAILNGDLAAAMKRGMGGY